TGHPYPTPPTGKGDPHELVFHPPAQLVRGPISRRRRDGAGDWVGVVSSVDTALQPAAARDQARALFGQTMGLVAVTAGLFALGAYLGRDLSYGWGFVWYIASFVV